MNHYVFHFEEGEREADGEDVVAALAKVLEDLGGEGLRSPLGCNVDEDVLDGKFFSVKRPAKYERSAR